NVSVEGIDSGTVIAHTFQSRAHAEGLLPSKRYLDILIEGAIEHGLSEVWVAMLQNTRHVDRGGLTWLRNHIFAVIRVMTRLGLPHPFRWWKNHHIQKTARKHDFHR